MGRCCSLDQALSAVDFKRDESRDKTINSADLEAGSNAKKGWKAEIRFREAMETSVAAGGAGDHPSAAGVKRRHPSSVPFRPPPPLAKPAETFFRLLCPVASSAGVIGKGGAVVRQIREETSARIRVDDPVPGSDDCVVFIIADTCHKAVVEPDGSEVCNEPSPAQMALIRVFERILRVERNWEGIGEDEEIKGSVVCRLLVPNGQVGCVIGKGGKIVEKIKTESGAQIRILGHEQVPACAAAGDELIHVSACT